MRTQDDITWWNVRLRDAHADDRSEAHFRMFVLEHCIMLRTCARIVSWCHGLLSIYPLLTASGAEVYPREMGLLRDAQGVSYA